MRERLTQTSSLLITLYNSLTQKVKKKFLPPADNKHAKNGITHFDTRTVTVADDNGAYTLDLSIAKLTDGSKVAYAKKNVAIDNATWAKIKKAASRSTSPFKQPSDDSVPQSDAESQEKFSPTGGQLQLVDSDGNALSEAQTEYFKDSKVRDESGWKAKINTGADGNIFELVENSNHDFGSSEKGKNTDAHKNVKRWEYFAKTVQIDKSLYDVIANVRMKQDGEFVYYIRLNENKKITASPIAELANSKSALKIGEAATDTIQQSDAESQEKISPTGGQLMLADYIDEYGEIEPGENPAREVHLPKKTGKRQNVSQTVRTILEAKATPDEIVPTVEKLVEQGDFSYTAYADEQAIEDATDKIQNLGWAKALTDWMRSVRRGEISKANTALGWALYNNAANSGDTETALVILDNMVEHQRSAAQALQATSTG